jgi:glutamate synthase (ferredoxin)
MKTGRDVAIACLLGAEEFGFSTAPLIASGCIMMRACHLNTCPVGIATQDPELRKNFKGKPEHVINYMYFVAEELRQIMAELGFRTIDEMVGQSQKLNMKKALDHYKAQGIDLSNILYKPEVPPQVKERNTQTQDHQLDNVLDFDILSQAHPALYRKEEQHLEYRIKNTNRTVGAILSNEISKIHGAGGLPKHTLSLKFTGTAGQSFGGFATHGLFMKVEGTVNDYFGKGLSGATLVAQVPEKSTFVPHENIIIGNVALYGATQGEAYINGIAGERFCVRNSGAKAVVEGIGDHGCEYMTGGIAVILGDFGRNFAAGMSGGIAYLYSEDGTFDEKKFNLEMVELEDLEDSDREKLQELLQNHIDYTQSPKAKSILKDWPKSSKNFIKVMPTDYKRALAMLAKQELEKSV